MRAARIVYADARTLRYGGSGRPVGRMCAASAEVVAAAAVAALADREAESERDVHRTLPDRNPLRGVLGHQDVGGDEEIDPARTEVQRQAECAAVVAYHRVAAREVEPVDRAEIDRPGDCLLYTSPSPRDS